MKARFWLFSLVVLSLVLMGSVPVSQAQASVPLTTGSAQVSQAYIDFLTTWYKHYSPQDWATRLNDALTPQPDWDQLQADEKHPKEAPQWIVNNPQGEHVILTGVPANAWWIDVWRMELDGVWTKIPAWQPAAQAPGPVSGDLMIQGKLPGAFVIRVCEKSGGVLLGGPKMIVVSWTNGTGGTWPQTFDVPSLLVATADQLANIKM